MFSRVASFREYSLHGKEGRYYFVEGGKRYEIEKWLAELSVESGFTIMEE